MTKLVYVRVLPLLVGLAIACGSSDGSGGADVTGPITSSDPASAQIVSSDLIHFWAAYDAGGKSGSASAFQTKYLDVASSGLVDFIKSRSVTASSLAQMVTSQPKYFVSIRGNNLGLATNSAVASRIRANYVTIKNLYPPALFPPLTLLVGRFSTGGTTSANGMLIGSEFYSIDATTPLDELVQFQRDNVKSVDSLPIIVAHEHAHVLQLNAAGVLTHSNKNLLEQSLMEGVPTSSASGRLAETSMGVCGPSRSRWRAHSGKSSPARSTGRMSAGGCTIRVQRRRRQAGRVIPAISSGTESSRRTSR
jgi:hypothetical protein